MKIALDIHGVIDTNPVFFAELAFAVCMQNHEIHILTGSRLGNGNIREWLDEEGIVFTHLFSIADHLREIGARELPQSTEENPWFCKKEWDIVKAEYCKEHKIDLCIDDCDSYLPHFITPIARFYSKDK